MESFHFSLSGERASALGARSLSQQPSRQVRLGVCHHHPPPRCHDISRVWCACTHCTCDAHSQRCFVRFPIVLWRSTAACTRPPLLLLPDVNIHLFRMCTATWAGWHVAAVQFLGGGNSAEQRQYLTRWPCCGGLARRHTRLTSILLVSQRTAAYLRTTPDSAQLSSLFA
jgi:hypothetical protein